MSWATALLVLVTLQRLAELVHARRNTRRLMAAGAVEIGADHYPLLVMLHASWLGALWILVATDHALLWWPAVYGYGMVEIARIWVMASLGRYWTTRILIPRDVPLVRRGPYRFLRHPNYWVVAFEIALLPLAFGSWSLAAVFSLLNAAVLFWRIRVEETSLAARRSVA
ncbi:isoprenylcysteine carboxyl methyltransferase family protein [Dongia sedimenti]|uniref:Isoprenylcysteine carboxylmethyltransferase family protein n=1 Tax=Dongia sedimenti TaxID=3064282 RepID=A0ABU0YT56_9PROT|nr:isoprenylcysteine carboxylmethyltransferase family protein [Rhodospirillaceae bacterium R-7]